MRNFTDIQTVLWINGPAAVNTKTGVLYINEDEFSKLGENSRRYVILHELGHLNAENKGEEAADEWAMEKLMGLNESSIDMLKAFYEAVPFSDYEQRERAENLLRKVFETEFQNGNEKAKSVIDIFNTIMPGDEDIKHFQKKGTWLKISGRIGQVVGGVLTAIPVTSVIGVGVTAAGSAQVAAGNNLASAYADGKMSDLEKEQYYSQLEKVNEVQKSIDEVEEKNNELDEQSKTVNKTMIGFVLVAVIVVAVVFYLLKD